MEEDTLSASGMYLHKSACTTAQSQNHACVCVCAQTCTRMAQIPGSTGHNESQFINTGGRW